MDSKPLTYLSMQCIIKHLEANKRFRLAAQCPSLVKIEKSQPLIIKKLEFNRSTISVNGVKYKLGARNNFEAPHTLTRAQLNGRHPQIHVKWLNLPDEDCVPELPESFKKFMVQYVRNWSSLTDRLIDPKSTPLLIYLSGGHNLDLLDVINRHEILRTCDGLMLYIVPRELFHDIGALPNSLIEFTIEGVEVFDFLILIDALLHPDREIETERIFITEDADLVANLFKAFTLLAEGNDLAMFQYELCGIFGDECDEFPQIFILDQRYGHYTDTSQNYIVCRNPKWTEDRGRPAGSALDRESSMDVLRFQPISVLVWLQNRSTFRQLSTLHVHHLCKFSVVP
ncbi:F-box C protein [Caenorhabditis elegans]|uniref:F-box C protein n=1 Tax=Caenorhabditis elegans TaxID=6239 RepID=Q9N3B1_CAEEL|nr:F-box C protein [Caenorhabditis elegans]CCD83509.1 F-box C protein [Caenorhabditis elegans]|eukprot:NP_500271.2 F-box C protein [Caenorhabditis elegans]